MRNIEKEFIRSYLAEHTEDFRMQHLLQALGREFGDARPTDKVIANFVKNVKKRGKAVCL